MYTWHNQTSNIVSGHNQTSMLDNQTLMVDSGHNQLFIRRIFSTKHLNLKAGIAQPIFLIVA